jgi:hypothetical protein
VLQEGGDNIWTCSECVIVNLDHSVSIGSNVDIDALCDVELAGITCPNGSDIFDQVSEHAKLEFKASPEQFNCCTSLESDSKSSLESCGAGLANDWKVVDLSAGAIKRQ